jgi:hypothetical protein
MGALVVAASSWRTIGLAAADASDRSMPGVPTMKIDPRTLDVMTALSRLVRRAGRR